MTNKSLTDVENIMFQMWENEFGVEPNEREKVLSIIRDRIKETAYHEAGHFIARLFVGLQDTSIRSISIIPNELTSGRVICGNGQVEHYIDQMPKIIQRYDGYRILIVLFAGLGSVMFMNGSEYESIFDYLWEEEPDVAVDADEDGTDLWRAERIARILSKPHFSKDQILGLTANWTLEMLKIPAVWSAIETLAEILVSRGEIVDYDEITQLVHDLNVPTMRDLPKWIRRILGK